MKTHLSNLDFWDEPLPKPAVRRLLRKRPVSRRARLVPRASAQPRRLRAWSLRRTRAKPTSQ